MGLGEQLFNSVKRINRRSVAIRPLHTDSIISLIVNIQRNDILRHIAFLQKLFPRKFIDALRALAQHSQYNQGSSPSSHSRLIPRMQDMFSGINLDFFRAGRREFPHYDSLVLLKRHIEGRSLNVPTSNHIADQLAVTSHSNPHRFREIVEDIAHLRFGMRYHNRQFVALRERQIDRQRKRVLDRELLLQLVSIGGS